MFLKQFVSQLLHSLNSYGISILKNPKITTSFSVLSPITFLISIHCNTFLIPYFVMLATEGIPVFYLELEIGQWLTESAIGVCNQVSPWLGAVAISSAVVSCSVTLHYQTVIACCLFCFLQVWELKLSQQLTWRLPSFGMWHRVVWCIFIVFWRKVLHSSSKPKAVLFLSNCLLPDTIQTNQNGWYYQAFVAQNAFT